MTVSPISNTGRIQSAIAWAANKAGVDFSYLLGQAKLESGLNASARASTSSASGLYQFIDQSWLSVVKQHGAQYGLGWAADSIQSSGGRMSVVDAGTRQAILALRNNPDVAAAMAAEHASDNADALQSTLGRTANGTDLYMAHFLGLGGARKFLGAMQASPGASGAALFPAAARANRNVFYNADGSAKSLADIYNRFSDKLGASAASAGTTQPLAPMYMVSRTLGLGGEATVITGAGEDASEAVQWASTTLDQLRGAQTTAQQMAQSASVLRPTPDTARLAYMMLASLGGQA